MELLEEVWAGREILLLNSLLEEVIAGLLKELLDDLGGALLMKGEGTAMRCGTGFKGFGRSSSVI